MDQKYIQLLVGKHACETGLDWFSDQETPEQAWQNCTNSSWMVWMAEELGVCKRKLVLATARMLQSVEHLIPGRQTKKALKVALRYGTHNATDEELKKAHKKVIATLRYSKDIDDNYILYDLCCVTYIGDNECVRFYMAADRNISSLDDSNICREVLTEEVFKKLKEIGL